MRTMTIGRAIGTKVGCQKSGSRAASADPTWMIQVVSLHVAATEEAWQNPHYITLYI